MEKAVGVICEFNPFHNGHAYFLRKVKEAFPEKAVVCVMSGNFVQRGSFAIQEKYSRAKCALLCGADLVLELPFPFSSLSAESFAASAISILNGIGVVDTLAFGSESADGDALVRCAENLASEKFKEAFLSFTEKNRFVGYPLARSRVYAELFGKTELLDQPNAILGLEYLMAIKKENAPISPFVIPRLGDTLRDAATESAYPSATAIRKMIFEEKDASRYLPTEALTIVKEEIKNGRFPVSMEYYAPTVFYLLRTKSRKELCSIYGLAPICDRANKMASSSGSLEELVEKLRSVNFTDSRVRRALLSLLCGVSRYAEKDTPAYTMVLAAGEKGRALLSEMKDSSEISVFTKPAHALKSKDKSVFRQASFSYLADDLYAAAFPKKGENGEFLKKSPYII